jgi:hypothetical protein
MKTILLIISICAVLVSCERCEVPSCVFNLTKLQNPPLEIWSYQYNNQLVYLTIGDCCDQYDRVYTSDCTLLCAPSGGITGKGDGKCPNFNEVAADGKLIWKAK